MEKVINTINSKKMQPVGSILEKKNEGSPETWLRIQIKIIKNESVFLVYFCI